MCEREREREREREGGERASERERERQMLFSQKQFYFFNSEPNGDALFKT